MLYSIYLSFIFRKITRIGQGIIQVVIWGKGRSLAYVQDNNVYYVPDVRTPHITYALTKDGVPGEIYHGVPDWLYEGKTNIIYVCREKIETNKQVTARCDQK